MIGLPDFLPKLSQRDLMVWWRNDVPAPLRDALWAVPPLALSQTRIAGNIELEGGLFKIDDDTVSAIVSMPQSMDNAPESATRQRANGAIRFDKVGLPDGSPGVFDPGWDSSMGVRPGADGTLKRFLVGHGLGSPFIEDVKLCRRARRLTGLVSRPTRRDSINRPRNWAASSYPWPSAVPLTDEELRCGAGGGGSDEEPVPAVGRRAWAAPQYFPRAAGCRVCGRAPRRSYRSARPDDGIAHVADRSCQIFRRVCWRWPRCIGAWAFARSLAWRVT